VTRLAAFTVIQPTGLDIPGFPVIERRLSQLLNVFADTNAFQKVLVEQNNPLIYSVSSVAPADGDGQLHYGLGTVMPGKIGKEYFMTRGHYHAWRPAAEVYVVLSGTGLMLLEDEGGDSGELVSMIPNSIIYVPGYTAHRTINTGLVPLTYLGIYPAEAGHDYDSLADTNFRHVVIDIDGTPTMVPRQAYLEQIQNRAEVDRA
jgi:glucose-6-phosphate isomerase, archaeal